MKHEDAQVPPADAGRLETPVRPCAWLREQRGEYEGPATLAPLMFLGCSEVRPHASSHGATYEPLYDKAALDAAVAAERERIALKLRGMDCAHVCGIGEELAALVRVA